MRRISVKKRRYAKSAALGVSAKIAPLVRGRGRIMAFRDLPREAQYALIHYMAVNGEAWEYPSDSEKPGGRWPPAYFDEREGTWKSGGKKVTSTSIYREIFNKYVEKYGDEQFGYAEIPIDDLIASVMNDLDIKDYGTWTVYHNWYVGLGDMSNHSTTNLWPVILSGNGDEEETLQDGWHRLHSYYRSGVKIVPAVWFPE